MPKASKAGGKTWTTMEESKLYELALANTPLWQIAHALGRSEAAVREKARALKLTLIEEIDAADKRGGDE